MAARWMITLAAAASSCLTEGFEKVDSFLWLGKAIVSTSSVSEQLGAIPEFRGLGPLFKSSPEPVALTELETEYVVRCTKHTFVSHMVFQVSSYGMRCQKRIGK